MPTQLTLNLSIRDSMSRTNCRFGEHGTDTKFSRKDCDRPLMLSRQMASVHFVKICGLSSDAPATETLEDVNVTRRCGRNTVAHNSQRQLNKYCRARHICSATITVDCRELHHIATAAYQHRPVNNAALLGCHFTLCRTEYHDAIVRFCHQCYESCWKKIQRGMCDADAAAYSDKSSETWHVVRASERCYSLPCAVV